MKSATFPIVTMLVCALLCSSCKAQAKAAHRRPPAPDFTGADSWLNTDKPISLKDLKGQVVLLDFWTYCCINCMHVFPDLHYIEEKYKGQPVVVIGIHSGKFDEEKDVDHIRQAILRNNITHPVAVDSQYKIWNAYGVSAWPTMALIDPEGKLVFELSGEGNRDLLDGRIADLLAEAKAHGTLGKPMHFRTERESFKSGVLEFPGKVLADSESRRLFISDTNHNRILVCDLGGKASRVIGSGHVGLKDGSFTEAQFHQPQGLALSADGKTLYIADTENHALRAADLSAGSVKTIAGDGSQAHIAPRYAPARGTPLSSPWALARVGSNLYIAMAGLHQIWVMDPEKNTLALLAGTSHEGDVDGPGADAWFAQPSGLTSDGSHLYVADSEASSIRTVDLGPGNRTTTIAGSADLFGFGRHDGRGPEARFQHPLGVALHGDTLFIADTYNDLIRAMDLKTGEVSTWLGANKDDADKKSPSNLYEPGGISVAGDTLYIADTNHHRVIAADIASKKCRVLDVRLPG